MYIYDSFGWLIYIVFMISDSSYFRFSIGVYV